MKELLLTVAIMFGSASVLAAGPAAPKVDCTKKANAGKLECKAPPKSDVKPAVKKPPKVERKAPPAVQKKAEANNKKEEEKKK